MAPGLPPRRPSSHLPKRRAPSQPRCVRRHRARQCAANQCKVNSPQAHRHQVNQDLVNRYRMGQPDKAFPVRRPWPSHTELLRQAKAKAKPLKRRTPPMSDAVAALFLGLLTCSACWTLSDLRAGGGRRRVRVARRTLALWQAIAAAAAQTVPAAARRHCRDRAPAVGAAQRRAPRLPPRRFGHQ